jgi:spore maturation protein CgeB
VDRRLLIIGNPNPIHVGAHLLRAAQEIGLAVEICDSNAAFDASWPIIKFNWQFRGHRPPKLHQFSQYVVEICRSFHPTWLLTTGLAPLTAAALDIIGQLGIIRLNFLTDDPWNPAHSTSWFLPCLPQYDWIFSPRCSNLSDLARAGCRHVAYLPFAYDPKIHRPAHPAADDERRRLTSDVLFAGGADPDRVPAVAALIRSGFQVMLYGGYWERFSQTRAYTHGHADMATLCKAIAEAKVVLCLVRRANRDGHVMRSFEIPAIGACMLVEDTVEHREIFGAEGDAVAYFRTIDEMIAKLHWLLDHDDERRRLAFAAHRRIVDGNHTYHDRLLTILNMARLEQTRMTAESIETAL